MTTRVARAAITGLVLAASLGLARAARAADADEAMLDKALGYLTKNQNADGSFGPALAPNTPPGEIGFTALAVKGLAEAQSKDAALGAAKKASIEKAVAWLLSQQKEDGSFTHERSGLTTYRTALSVMALVAVDKTKHKAAIDKAVKWLSEAQWEKEEASPHYGGWGYDKTGTKPDADLSNSQMALAALKEAGVGADDPVMKRAVLFLSRCQNNTETNKGVTGEVKLVPKNDGGFFYGPSRATVKETEVKNADGSISYDSYASMTYAGLVSLCYAGLTKDDGRVKAALNWAKDHYTFDENSGLGAHATDPKGAQRGLYYYYFTFARAMDTLGVKEIETKDGKKAWAKDLLEALRTRQKPDGSWVNDADRWQEGQAVLVTAYCVSSINLAMKHR